MAQIPDTRINIYINHTLVKQGIDTSKIRWSTQNGNVYIDGEMFHVSSGRVNSPQMMHILERQIRTIDGVRSIRFKLDGWRKVGGDWVLTKKEMAKHQKQRESDK